MLAILTEAALSAFGRVLLDFFLTWKASEDARARGRAEAAQDATIEALRVERDMSAVEIPERDELLKRLREGMA